MFGGEISAGGNCPRGKCPEGTVGEGIYRSLFHLRDGSLPINVSQLASNFVCAHFCVRKRAKSFIKRLYQRPLIT